MRRVSLLLALGLSLAACSGTVHDAKGGSPLDRPGDPGGGGGSGGGSGASGPPGSGSGMNAPGQPPPVGCAELLPISAASLQDLPAAPTAKLRVRVRSNVSPAPARWSWEARHGDGAGEAVEVTALDEQASVVELPLLKAGRYSLTATAAAPSSCTVAALAFAQATESRLGQFRIRATPPAGAFPVQESAVQVRAGTPATQTLALQRGQEVVFDPQDAASSRNIASYVRVTQNRVPLVFEGHTARAPFRPQLLAPFSYDVLFVPDDDVAPFVLTGQTPSAINVSTQKLTPGSQLTGKLLDGVGAPLRDGRVILRAGALTSTVGASSPEGDFSLRVRAGQFAVTIAPPPASGLPELALAPENGLAINDGAAVGRLEVRWAPVTSAPVGLILRKADGNAAAGARVRLDRVGSLPNAGTLMHQPPTGQAITRAVPGYVRIAAQAGADGAVALAAVPPGQYRLLVTPGDTDQASALATLELEVPAGGIAGRMVRLSARVKLRGILLPGEAAAGTRVYATPQTADPPRPVAAAVVAAGGRYELEVDPDRRYVVWADPGPGRARTQLATVMAGADGAEVPERTLPRALAFSGVVMGDRTPLPGTVIQLYCDVAAPSCLDPTLPLADGISGPRGEFTLALPDPGSF